jgi:hypothetical protein
MYVQPHHLVGRAKIWLPRYRRYEPGSISYHHAAGPHVIGGTRFPIHSLSSFSSTWFDARRAVKFQLATALGSGRRRPIRQCGCKRVQRTEGGWPAWGLLPGAPALTWTGLSPAGEAQQADSSYSSRWLPASRPTVPGSASDNDVEDGEKNSHRASEPPARASSLPLRV